MIKSSLKSNFYLKSDTGDFEYVHKKQDKYFRREKRKLVLAEPQPNSDSIIIVNRYYSKHKKNHNYQRRVSWLENFPERDLIFTKLLCLSILVRFPVKQLTEILRKATNYCRTKSCTCRGFKTRKETVGHSKGSGTCRF